MSFLDFYLEKMASPIGDILIITDEQRSLRALDWCDHQDRCHVLMRRHYKGNPVTLRESPHPSPAFHALAAYFAGDLAAINALDVAMGGTDFQRHVWGSLRSIPAGQTVSYRDLARRIGRPTAFRAVGLANGANPISIVIPCHRVIGSNASLTGYGGGLYRKQWLLNHEQTWA